MLTPDTAFPRDAEFLDYIRSFVDESRLSRAAVDRLFALARRGADAADEITRLRAALRFWMKAYRTHQHEPLVIAYESTLNRFPDLEARAALGGGDEP